MNFFPNKYLKDKMKRLQNHHINHPTHRLLNNLLLSLNSLKLSKRANKRVSFKMMEMNLKTLISHLKKLNK